MISDDWTAVQRDVNVPLDLETTPLEIRTNTELRSNEEMFVWFLTADGEGAVGGLQIFLSYTGPMYYIFYCSSSRTNFPSNLPTEVDKIWRITLDKTAGIRLQIHCNGVEVLNVLLSDNTCGESYWGKFWSKDVDNIYFRPSFDTVSLDYRAGQTGTR